MTILNRDMIMQELLGSMNPEAPQRTEFSKEKELSEYYTVGFRTPRQSGSTFWLIEKLIEDRNAVIVLINSNFKVDFLNQVELYPKNRTGNTATYGPLVERGILNGDKDSIVERCFTAREFLNANLDRNRYATAVFFDGGSTIVDKINMNAYYKKLVDGIRGNPITWLID